MNAPPTISEIRAKADELCDMLWRPQFKLQLDLARDRSSEIVCLLNQLEMNQKKPSKVVQFLRRLRLAA